MIFKRLKWLLVGTLRRQLMIGMLLILATMMSLLVWGLTRRQNAVAVEQQTERAAAMARSVAGASANWLAARDVAGLQEIVQGLSQYPDLSYAIVLDSHGHVLAHSSEPNRLGQYLTDLPSTPAWPISRAALSFTRSWRWP